MRTTTKRYQALEQRLAERNAELTRLREEFQRTQLVAMTDPLTGLASRSCFAKALYSALMAAELSAGHLSLLMVDIDHFKRVNDQRGHLAGDMVLQYLSRVLEHNVNAQGLPARYGGDEFAVLLPNTRLEEATFLADRIRRLLARAQLVKRDCDESSFQITISIGVAQYREGESAYNLMRSADNALYMAKREGRNCVRSCDDLQSRPEAQEMVHGLFDVRIESGSQLHIGSSGVLKEVESTDVRYTILPSDIAHLKSNSASHLRHLGQHLRDGYLGISPYLVWSAAETGTSLLQTDTGFRKHLPAPKTLLESEACHSRRITTTSSARAAQLTTSNGLLYPCFLQTLVNATRRVGNQMLRDVTLLENMLQYFLTDHCRAGCQGLSSGCGAWNTFWNGFMVTLPITVYNWLLFSISLVISAWGL